MLTDSKLRPSFVSWLAGECRVVSRKRNRLALSQTLLMKAGGSSRSSLELASRQVRFVFISFSRCLSSFVPTSTLYRGFRTMSDTARANVLEELADDMLPRLHWVDNFASTMLHLPCSSTRSC